LSSPRIDLVREGVEALDHGDIEALEQLFDPGLQYFSRLAATEGRSYDGHDGLRRYLVDIEDTFSSFEREVIEVHEIGGKVLTRIEVHAVGRGSGLKIDQEIWSVMSFRGDCISRVEVFFEHDEALAAAGD
jgi:ketosteroid isomerase-like protein